MNLRSRRIWKVAAAAAAICAVAGCGKTPPPPFRLDMTNVVAKQIAPDQRQAIADILDAMFGTPDEPYAMPETGLDQRKLRMSAGPVWSDELTRKHGLYRRHCAHCHGISGDGHGPTAMILNPYPRDYRPGVFKFKSTALQARPTNDDLRRIVHNGVPGTAMPSFALLPPDEVEALVEYVKYLSMRGQMEIALERYVNDEVLEKPMDPASDAALRTTIGEFLTEIAEGWKTAAEQVVAPEEASIPKERTPDEVKASIAKGRELFYGGGQCFSCHGPTGLGDGQQSGFDDWTKPLTDFIAATAALPDEIHSTKQGMAKLEGPEREEAQERLDEQVRELSERRVVSAHFLMVRNAIPRDLREGMYRGGGRPIDLFWRVSTGIAGTPMPAAPNTLTQEQIWQIVDYVHSLPFEPASRPMESPKNVADLVK